MRKTTAVMGHMPYVSAPIPKNHEQATQAKRAASFSNIRFARENSSSHNSERYATLPGHHCIAVDLAIVVQKRE
jgi:hypothetical protein